jgi:2-polyprenyl-3-methyl-5-hydroxy-6-metoxy-1,4-benzoquinol methylase
METPTGHDQNADQIAFWNGLAGQHWTDRQQAQDAILAPVSDILIDRAKARAGEWIVDVGCGCGATTIALAQKVGPTGHVLGIDISAPMWPARDKSRRPACRPILCSGTQRYTRSSLRVSTSCSRGSG